MLPHLRRLPSALPSRLIGRKCPVASVGRGGGLVCKAARGILSDAQNPLRRYDADITSARRTFATNATSTYPDVTSRPFRSVLYVPAVNTRALEKLSTLRPDAVMFDLEDGVGPDKKEEARENLARFFREGHHSADKDAYFGMVRINRSDTPWFEDDLKAAWELWQNEGANVRGVVLPKIEGREDVDAVSRRLLQLAGDATCDSSTSPVVSPVPFWAMMETPLAILSALEIAAHPSIQGLILGTNDLSKELRLRPSAKCTTFFESTREGLAMSLQTAILAARAHGKLVIDGVYNNFRDEEGFRQEAMQGKVWGMDGKTLIHPSQIAATNELLAPSKEEIEHAKRVVECWEENAIGSDGGFTGVAVLDGVMLEDLHAQSARRLLEQAERIESSATGTGHE
ncbi:hypothetical protein ACHAXT_002889 [Thalassiosira profunda]